MMTQRTLRQTALVSITCLLLVSTGAVAIGVQPQQSQPSNDTDSQLPNTIVITSTADGRTFYEFTISGEINYGEKADRAGGPSNPTHPDTISGNTASGSSGKGGVDSFTFSGEITSFSLNGSATVSVNGEQIDPSTLPSVPPTQTATTTPPSTATTTPPSTDTATRTQTPTTTATQTATPTPTTRPNPSVSVTELSVSSQSVAVGEIIEFTATVENTGGSVTTVVDLTTHGKTVASRRISLSAGETRTISFTYAYNESGTYTASIGSQQLRIRVGSGSGAAAGTSAENTTSAGNASADSGGGGGLLPVDGISSAVDGIIDTVTGFGGGLLIVVLVVILIQVAIVVGGRDRSETERKDANGGDDGVVTAVRDGDEWKRTDEPTQDDDEHSENERWTEDHTEYASEQNEAQIQNSAAESNERASLETTGQESAELGHDEMYCTSCGEPIKQEAAVCPNCGVRQTSESRQPINRKSPGIAAILSFVIPGLGQAYTGNVLRGVAIFVSLIMIVFFLVFSLIGIILVFLIEPIIHIAAAYDAYSLAKTNNIRR